MVYKYFDKKSEDIDTSITRADKYAASCVTKTEIMLKQQLAKELHKSITRELNNFKYAHLLKIIYGIQT